MLHCDKCKIEVTGAPERCPLCQGTLTGEPDERGGLFVPLGRQKKKQNQVFAIVTMSALAAIVVSLAVNYLTGFERKWCLFVIGGAVCAWLFAVVGWRKRKELAKNIFIQTMVVSVAGIFWDLLTGWHGWSLDFIIPCACIAAVLALSALAVILQLESSDYVAYLLTVASYGIVPLVFLLLGIVKVAYPSVICSALCVLILASLLLFFRRNTVDELKKKLHM